MTPGSQEDCRAWLEEATDLPSACLIAGRLYELIAQSQETECAREGCDGRAGVAFWRECAAEANRARCIYLCAEEGESIVDLLQSEGLSIFADALLTGRYAEHLCA